MFAPCFAVHYFVSNHLDREEKADCSTLFVFKCLVKVIVLWLFLMVPWVGLQCVSEIFPDHTSLFLEQICVLQVTIALSEVCTCLYLEGIYYGVDLV